MFSFNSCEKDQSNTHNDNPIGFNYTAKSNIPYDQLKLISKGFTGKNLSEVILYFPDMNVLRFVLNDLKSQVAEYDDAFNTMYGHLGVEQIIQIAINLNYDSETPMKDFADYYQFISLHKHIAELEFEFLSGDEIDWNKNPNNHFVDEDEVRAILNTDCEVMVGDSIYKLTEYGYYAIAATNLKSLAMLDSGKTDNLEGVVFVGNDPYNKSDCNSNKRDSGHKMSISGNYRIMWVVSHWTHPWDRRVIAKIDNYIKNNSWINPWKKAKANSTCKVYGFISDLPGDCSRQLNFNPNNDYSYKALTESLEHRIDVVTKTKSGWVKGYFKGIDNIEHIQTLTW